MTRSRVALASILVMSFTTGDVFAAARRTSKAASAPKVEKVTQAGREKEARTQFQRAEKAFSVGKFDEALGAYEQAYEAMPLPPFVFNIAQCYRNLGRHERAVFFYRRYLALEPNPPNKTLVQELIAEEQIRLEDEEAAAARRAQPAEVALGVQPGAATDGSQVGVGLVQPAPQKDRRLTRQWWFWTAIGGVVAISAAALLIERQGARPSGTLGSVDLGP